jgi:hypothetical protein
MANKWIQHVQSYASKNGINYRDALKDPKCKAAYKKGPSSMKSSKKMRGGLKDPCDHLQGEAYAECARGSGNYEGGRKSKRRRCGKKRRGTRKR